MRGTKGISMQEDNKNKDDRMIKFFMIM